MFFALKVKNILERGFFMTASKFGAHVKILRLEKEWSRKELGEKVYETTGVKFAISSLSNWENNGAEPPYNVLMGLAKIFGVSVDFLIGYSDEFPYKEIDLETQSTPSIELSNSIVENSSTISHTSNDVWLIPNELQDELSSLPVEKRELLKSQLDEFLIFLNFKYEKFKNDCQFEYDRYQKYLKYEIKNASQTD